MSHVYRLSTTNDGSWGNAGETDEDVVHYCEKLAELIVDNFPGIPIEVQLVHDFVNNQPECDGVLAETIKAFVNDNYGEAIDAVETEKADEQEFCAECDAPVFPPETTLNEEGVCNLCSLGDDEMAAEQGEAAKLDDRPKATE